MIYRSNQLHVSLRCYIGNKKIPDAYVL